MIKKEKCFLREKERQRRKEYRDLNRDREIFRILLEMCKRRPFYFDIILEFCSVFCEKFSRKVATRCISHCPFDFIIIFVFEHIHISFI